MKSIASVRLRAGLIAFALVLSQVVMPVQSAFANHGESHSQGPAPSTNNSGMIKVIEPGAANEVPDTDPKLSTCSVEVEFYNFNNTVDMNASVVFTPQAPTASSIITVSGASQSPAIVGDGDSDGEGSNDFDGSFVYTLAFTGTPQAQQGYKVKLDVDAQGTNGGTKTKVFYMPESCRKLTTATPAAPSSVDPCGIVDDTYTIPTTLGVEYYVGTTLKTAGTYKTNGATSLTITAKAMDGYTLSGISSWPQTFSNSQCGSPVLLPAPLSNDPCGLGNVSWATQTATAEYTWQVQGGRLIVNAKPGYYFVVNGQPVTTYDFGSPVESLELCPVATPCTVSDKMYDRVWSYDGDAYPEAGAWPTGTSGSFDFQDDGLYLNTPAVESYVSGLFDGGNTPLADVDAMSYKVLRQVKSAGVSVTLPAYILSVDTNGLVEAGGQTYFFYEPYYNDNDRAAVEGQFQTWDAYKNGEALWYRSGTLQKRETWNTFVGQFPKAVVLAHGFNQGTSNAETYTVVQDIEFDCATITFRYFQGNGGGGTPTPDPEVPVTPTTSTPVAVQGNGNVTAGELPAELPMTGNGGMLTTWFALLAAILTYGAVLYLQPKKRAE